MTMTFFIRIDETGPWTPDNLVEVPTVAQHYRHVCEARAILRQGLDLDRPQRFEDPDLEHDMALEGSVFNQPGNDHFFAFKR